MAPGIYDENLNFGTKSFVLRSEAGAAATIVDGGRRGSVLTIAGGGMIEGFTVRGGHGVFAGGGISVEGPSPLTIQDNIIEDNIAGPHVDAGSGGGIFLGQGTQGVIVQRNTIRDNYAGASGGGILDAGWLNQLTRNRIERNGCHVCGGGIWMGGTVASENLVIENWSDSFGAGMCGTGVEIRNNTVIGNQSFNSFRHGAGIHITEGRPTLANNLVVRNVGAAGFGSGVGILCGSGGEVTLLCNDSWGNDGGDYLFCESTGGDMSLDPLFCGEESGDYTIQEDSPCAPGVNEVCGLVGAFSVGCGATQSRTTATWGRVKATYR